MSLLSICACVVGSTATAQNTFNSQGEEFALVGDLPGDQVNPDVAIDASGGYVVWQDSLGDGQGFGIHAQWLDSGLLTPFGRFRVNQQAAGDQERPRVALFPNGGAVFVWQSREGDQYDVYARFLSPDRTFLTDEIRVNVFDNQDQMKPSVAILSDGNAVIVWQSMDQDGSMLGIYGQIMSADGARIGGEFQLNETTAYNQQAPSVAALANGGFVATWISENTPIQTATAEAAELGAVFSTSVINRIYPYARVFSNSGAAAGSEFRVSESNGVASNPSVNGSVTGGFAVVWTQKHETDPQQSYDVFMRQFNAAGGALSDESRVNAEAALPQYASQIDTLGGDHLVVWTSYGQDGSREGVFGRFVSTSGEFLSGDLQFNTLNTASSQMHPAIATDGLGKMVAVWSSFQAGSSFDIYLKRYDASGGLPTPPAPYVHRASDAGLAVSWPSLTGYGAIEYLVYMDGGQEPVAVTSGNGVMIDGLAAGSLHTFRIAYRFANGEVSEKSAAAAATTWGADANMDGLPDEWQAGFWGGARPGPELDSDNDGVSNLNEFLSGTDPTDPDSVLAMAIEKVNGTMQLRWNSMPGGVYKVQRSQNLKNWTDVGTEFATSGNSAIDLDTLDLAAFYRVVLQR